MAYTFIALRACTTVAQPYQEAASGTQEKYNAALEAATDRPGLFSFEPGPGAARRIGEGLDRLLGLPAAERADLREGIRAFVEREWSWRRTAERLLDAAAG